MFLTASANGALPKQSHQTGQSFDRYTEQEIQQVATDLLKHGYHSWSNNPRLYIILRDIGQIKDTSQPQTLDVLLKNGLNDMWIPITTDTTLQRLLKPEIYFQFLQAQNSVCIQSTSFRLRTPGFHGHFATRYDAPFERRRSIGRGRIGRVDEVLSLTDRRVYARKSIRKVSDFGDTRGRDDIERFRCEVRVLRRIQHRHCVRIVSRPILLSNCLKRIKFSIPGSAGSNADVTGSHYHQYCVGIKLRDVKSDFVMGTTSANTILCRSAVTRTHAFLQSSCHPLQTRISKTFCSLRRPPLSPTMPFEFENGSAVLLQRFNISTRTTYGTEI